MREREKERKRGNNSPCDLQLPNISYQPLKLDRTETIKVLQSRWLSLSDRLQVNNEKANAEIFWEINLKRPSSPTNIKSSHGEGKIKD